MAINIENGVNINGLTGDTNSLTIDTSSLVVKKSDGKVGIGITSPTASLEVKGSGSGSTTDTLRLSNSVDSTSILVQDDGKIGIGTNAPFAGLEIKGLSQFGETIRVSLFDNTPLFTARWTGKIGINTFSPVGTLHVKDTNVSGIFGDIFVLEGKDGTTHMRMLDTGNVSIGVNSPVDSKLHVRGATVAANKYSLRVEGSGGTHTMVATDAGNVGIGPSIFFPSARLHVDGSVRFQNLTTTPVAGHVLTATDALGNMDWQPAAGGGDGIYGGSGSLAGATTVTMGTNDFVMSTTGDANVFNIDGATSTVAIGTAAPVFGNTKLGLHQNTSTSATVFGDNLPFSSINTGGIVYRHMRSTDANNALWQIDSYTHTASGELVTSFAVAPQNTGSFAVLTRTGTATYERLRVRNNGFIGINTSNPTERLHVAGNIRMVDGNQAAGKVLTSDANGVGTWQSAGFTGNTSGDCITDLHVTNIHSCSPLNINPNNEGAVSIGSNSVDIQGPTGLLTQLTVNKGAGPGGAAAIGVGLGAGVNPTSALQVNQGTNTNAIYSFGDVTFSGDGVTHNINFSGTRIDGNVGIGTFIPTEKLQVVGGGVRFQGSIDTALFYVNHSTNRVGIGTTGPSDKLHVLGDMRITTGSNTIYSLTSVNTPRFTIETSAANTLNRLFIWNTADSAQLQMGHMGSSFVNTIIGTSRDTYILASPNTGRMNFINQAGIYSDDFQFFAARNANTTPTMIISQLQRVGINTAAPLDALHVVGRARISSYASEASIDVVHRSSSGRLIASTSDERLKTNIVTIDSALDKVKNLRGVYFNWKSDIDNGVDIRRVGFIAQEVSPVVPELAFVNKDSEKNYMGVRYQDVTALLVESVKELSTVKNYTPTSSSDESGELWSMTTDNDYIYIKTESGWKRTSLESF